MICSVLQVNDFMRDKLMNRDGSIPLWAEMVSGGMVSLTHCILNRLSHTLYWKSPVSILGTPSYDIYIFLQKNG